MSVRLMAAVWEMDLTPVEKLVFLALADCANDEGVAWPSVATIRRKSNVGERTVQRSLRAMEEAGHLTRKEVTGKGCKYFIHPRHAGTPATKSPPPENTQTPATVAPKPSRTITDLPNGKSKRVSVARPEDVNPQVWGDFVSHRKRLKADLTVTALEGIKREAAKAGWGLEDALTECVTRGWRGFKAEWIEKAKINDHRQGNSNRNTFDLAMQKLGRAANG